MGSMGTATTAFAEREVVAREFGVGRQLAVRPLHRRAYSNLASDSTRPMHHRRRPLSTATGKTADMLSSRAAYAHALFRESRLRGSGPRGEAYGRALASSAPSPSKYF